MLDMLTERIVQNVKSSDEDIFWKTSFQVFVCCAILIHGL